MSEASAPSGFETIARMVAERTGLGLQQRGAEDLERAARRAMQRAGVSEMGEFARALAKGGADWDDLIEEVTVRETYFYRTPEHFELVRSHVLPALRRARGPEHGVRAWSAGCASGEEAYSLAMLLHQEQLLANAQVHGSDICERALERARAGRYRDWSLRGLDPQLASLYLRADGNEMVVREALRTKVTFSHVNLTDPSYAAPGGNLAGRDLIFCRNVMIYFDAVTIARVERGLFEALAPEGWLIIGPSDPVLGTNAPFEVITTAHGLLYHKPSTSAVRRPLAPAASPRSAQVPLRSATPVSTAAQRSAAHRARAPRADAALPTTAPTAETQTAPEALATQRVRETWRASGAASALSTCDQALGQHVLHAELHYLRALALMDLGCRDEAAAALRRCLYLDRSLIMAHFTLGTVLQRMGDAKAARTAYRNVIERGADIPGTQLVALGEGVDISTVTAAAGRALLALEDQP